MLESLGFIQLGKKLNFQRSLQQLVSSLSTNQQNNRDNRNRDNSKGKFNKFEKNYDDAYNSYSKQKENELKKKENFESFQSTGQMQSYLKNRLRQAEEGEDIAEILSIQLFQVKDILSRPNLDNYTISLVIKLFLHRRFEQTIHDTFQNRLILELIQSQFFLSVLNFQRYINEIQYEDEFVSSINFINFITTRYQDSIRLMPIEIFKLSFESKPFNQNQHIKQLLVILRQKKIIQNQLVNQDNSEINNISHDEIIYKNLSIVPNKLEIKSKSLPKLRSVKLNSTPEEYLDTLFNLNREDMVHPIREALGQISSGKSSPYHYYDVIFKGFQKTPQSLSFLIEFKYRSKIKCWSRFSKLLNGSLLVLSADNFETVHFAIVEKRPDKGSDLEISISFFNNNNTNNNDENQDNGEENNFLYLFENVFQMIESPTYFESVRNVLTSLQSIDPQELPFQSYLLKCSSREVMPLYLSNQPYLSLHRTFEQCEPINLKTSEFPEQLGTLDPSQVEAFEHCLKSELSLVVGPPGTGKSYLGVKLFEVIYKHLNNDLQNPNQNNAPILLLCYTNHALDQFLNAIIQNVTEEVIRVGSRSRDENLRKYNLRKYLQKEKGQTRYYLERDNVVSILKQHLLEIQNVLTYQDFIKYSSEKKQNISSIQWDKWLKSIKSKINQDLNLIKKSSTGNDQLDPEESDELGEDEEDEDIVNLLLNERNFESVDQADISDYDIQNIMSMTRMEKKEFEEIDDIDSIDVESRIYYYRYLLDLKIKNLLNLIQNCSSEYRRLSSIIMDYEYKSYQRALSSVKVVAATTTAASRLKRVFDQINSKVVIIEEAAEILEGHIVATLPKTTQHLILIGDHEQLKPSCAVYQLSEKYKLSVSLFERIIRNGGAYRQLEYQRRMVPNISRFIKPIYPTLKNHPEVKKRSGTSDEKPVILGMPSNLLFISHNQYENSNDPQSTLSTSKSNLYEAKFICNLAQFLLKQGYDSSDLVILTPYTGQLLKIKSQIRNQNNPVLSKVQVRTVDQFQGEERNIVLLSLVRSNPNNDSGFVKIQNRINVAISRARNAMYLIGNRQLLEKAHSLWANMFEIMESEKLIGPSFSIKCRNHPDQITVISKPEDFKNVPEGGCLRKCNYRLDCGHGCSSACHLFDPEHKNIQCTRPCDKIREGCQHKCQKLCGEDCGSCQFKVERTLKCGHTIMLPCSIDIASYKCKEPCKRKRLCGHSCPFTCGEYCEKDRCRIKVEKHLPCGHTLKTDCFNNSSVCDAKCKDKLPCGDTCSAKCKDHIIDPITHQRTHPKCSKQCSRALICGHICQGKHECNSPCPPCEKKCNNECSHSKCSKSCKDICHHCKEACNRGCQHVGFCSRFCKDKCTIKNCNEPCPKKLKKCGHPCIGICGEKCPSVCRICDITYKEPITQMTLGEFEPTDTFIEIHSGHVFSVDSLDTYMNMKDETNQIKLKKCPSCAKILTSKDLPRYKDIINGVWHDIDIIKKKLREKVTKEEIDQVVGAMGGAAGHWFRCPNGHVYYIDNCGGAMQVGKCIECKEAVGGSNHRLLATNSHSTIDGSTRPLYRDPLLPDDQFN